MLAGVAIWSGSFLAFTSLLRVGPSSSHGTCFWCVLFERLYFGYHCILEVLSFGYPLHWLRSYGDATLFRHYICVPCGVVELLRLKHPR